VDSNIFKEVGIVRNHLRVQVKELKKNTNYISNYNYPGPTGKKSSQKQRRVARNWI